MAAAAALAINEIVKGASFDVATAAAEKAMYEAMYEAIMNPSGRA